MRGPWHATGLIAQEIAMDELAANLELDCMSYVSGITRDGTYARFAIIEQWPA